MPLPGSDGLDADFNSRLDQLAAVCDISITSGKRSRDEQAQLYEAYKNGTGNLAAPPGSSNHETGLAADIGGDKGCAHAHAAAYGLHFPVDGEDWHIEPVGLRETAGTPGGPSPDAYVAPPPGNPIPTLLAAVSQALSPQAPQIGSIKQLSQDLGKKPTPPVVEANGTVRPPNSITGGMDTGQGDVSGGWFEAFLNRIGAPVTPENLRFLDAWKRAEGGSDDNPFNTTMDAPGATVFNSVGVKRYPDLQTGLDATVRTILEDHAGYADIVGALRAGGDAMSAANALAGSAWGTGGLVQKILG